MENNGKIIYTNEVTFSSSKILNDLELLLDPKQLKEVKYKKIRSKKDIQKIYNLKKLKF